MPSWTAYSTQFRRRTRSTWRLLLGDFNARVVKDHLRWSGTIGKEGVGKVNENGTLLPTKCAEHNLVITNTLFRQKNRYKTSWQHPRSKHWHLIGYIIVRFRDQQDVLKTRAVTGAGEGWTDHRLISAAMRLTLRSKRKHQNQNSTKKCYLSKTSPSLTCFSKILRQSYLTQSHHQ